MVVDALPHRYPSISTLSSKLLGFEQIIKIYADDFNFSTLYNACEHNGFLLKDGKLCILNYSLRNY